MKIKFWDWNKCFEVKTWYLVCNRERSDYLIVLKVMNEMAINLAFHKSIFDQSKLIKSKLIVHFNNAHCILQKAISFLKNSPVLAWKKIVAENSKILAKFAKIASNEFWVHKMKCLEVTSGTNKFLKGLPFLRQIIW